MYFLSKLLRTIVGVILLLCAFGTTAARAQTPAPPAPSAIPLASDTTLENVKLESEIVSYKAMSEAADLISKQIKGKKANAKNIAIYDAQVIKDWRFYRALFPAFEGQIIDIKTQYKTLLCKTPRIAADVEEKTIAVKKP